MKTKALRFSPEEEEEEETTTTTTGETALSGERTNICSKNEYSIIAGKSVDIIIVGDPSLEGCLRLVRTFSSYARIYSIL